MAISTFTTPYPDFVNNEIINPDEFDANSAQIASKLNELIPRVNAHDKSQWASDTGGVFFSVNLSTDNLLTTIQGLPQGVYTFYANGVCQGLPSNTAGSMRGMVHKTSVDICWLWAIDFQNNFFTNYMNTGNSWGGWRKYVHDAPPTFTNLPLSLPAIAYSAGYTPRYTKLGNVVYIEGAIKGLSAVTTTIATLPVGWRPNMTQTFSIPTSGKEHARWSVSTGGLIVLENTTSASAPTTADFFPLNMSFLSW